MDLYIGITDFLSIRKFIKLIEIIADSVDKVIIWTDSTLQIKPIIHNIAVLANPCTISIIVEISSIS